MEQVVYARIDERLIHGQVSLRWKEAYGVTRYIVVNEEAAKNTFRQKLLMANDDTPADFGTVEQAVQWISQYPQETLLVIAKGPKEILELAEAGISFRTCNIGNMHMDPQRIQVGSSVAISPEEKEVFIQLRDKGVPLEMRCYPDSESEPLDAIFE